MRCLQAINFTIFSGGSGVWLLPIQSSVMSSTLLTMIKILLCVLLGCVVVSFGASRQKIGQGRVVKNPKRYSFIMYVEVCFSDEGCIICTGTLVKPKVVLVAAHCFCSDKSLKKIHVYAKSPDRKKWLHRKGKRMPNQPQNPEPYECLSTKVMPKVQVGTDIAMITMKRPFPKIKPAEMVCGSVPTEGQRIKVISFDLKHPKENSELRISGGKTIACPSWLLSKKPLCTSGRENLIESQLGNSGGPLLMKKGKQVKLMGVAYEKITYNGKTSEAWTNVAPYCVWINAA